MCQNLTKICDVIQRFALAIANGLKFSKSKSQPYRPDEWGFQRYNPRRFMLGDSWDPRVQWGPHFQNWALLLYCKAINASRRCYIESGHRARPYQPCSANGTRTLCIELAIFSTKNCASNGDPILKIRHYSWASLKLRYFRDYCKPHHCWPYSKQNAAWWPLLCHIRIRIVAKR
jgi:hypothetical protein